MFSYLFAKLSLKVKSLPIKDKRSSLTEETEAELKFFASAAKQDIYNPLKTVVDEDFEQVLPKKSLPFKHGY